MNKKREWKWKSNYETDTSKGQPGYDSKLGDISFAWGPNYAAGKIMALKDKQILFKIKDSKGKSYVHKGKLDFLEAKYKEPKHPKEYNFEKFTNGIAETAKKKSMAAKLRGNFVAATSANDASDTSGEFDTIKMDSTDSKYFLENDDAIVFDLNRKKEDKN